MKQNQRPTNRLFDASSRRTFLKLTGGTAGLVGLSTVTGAQTGTFRLQGGIGRWVGQAPSSIADQGNPTLELEPGETYRVEWTNIDGFDHNFVILDTEGDEVVRTEVVSEQGATQSVEFEATEEMTEYICEIHPRTMRGQVTVGGQENPAPRREVDIPLGATVGIETVAEGLTAPLAFAVPPGEGDRRFVVDQTGQIYVLTDDGLRDEPFLDVGDQLVELGVPNLNGYDERGLLGLAFHPDFRENRRFYVHYSAPPREGTPEDYDHTSVIAEFEAEEGMANALPDSERTILEIPSPQMNHDGGDVAFGPDGYLYIGIGDGGAADDVGPAHVEDWYDVNEGGNGQDVTENLLGSVLRIDVDSEGGDTPYGIPDDNPLVGEEGLDEHYAWGFRNPRSMSFNDGELFVADAGQNLYEEVDVVERGGNYGWNVKEGTHCFSTENPSESLDDCPDSTPDDVRGGEPLLDPIIEYRHRESTTAMIDGSVVVGGFVYDGDALSDLRGTYVFGNWSGQGVVEPDGEIFVATPPAGSPWSDDSAGEAGTPTGTATSTPGETGTATGTPDGTAGGEQLWSVEELVIGGTEDGQLNRYVLGFGRDSDGELYVLTSENFTPTGDTGAVHRLVPAEEPAGTPTGTETGTPTGTETGTPTGTSTETPQ
ncbi:PQQ-dependent sugar dehydrogenase [Halorarum salinum]|uniref:PQQ-dependent sugar dehydrogenase n=1 Tax=Halorarum salinum TaxID=2743089 RepID=A0A7D5LA96_9EURY|nr:PQQ-dependent sugar dehydrogenase [Halobaculum salinum]QLG61429.1 PQQ-dependent sugar dehydrogenase [Halobaculum salinum]